MPIKPGILQWEEQNTAQNSFEFKITNLRQEAAFTRFTVLQGL